MLLHLDPCLVPRIDSLDTVHCLFSVSMRQCTRSSVFPWCFMFSPCANSLFLSVFLHLLSFNWLPLSLISSCRQEREIGGPISSGSGCTPPSYFGPLHCWLYLPLFPLGYLYALDSTTIMFDCGFILILIYSGSGLFPIIRRRSSILLVQEACFHIHFTCAFEYNTG